MADWPPLKNSAFTVTFPIYDADGDLVTGQGGSADSEVSIDGNTFTDVSPGEAAEIATSSGVYKLALSASEMDGDIIATITKSGSGKTAVNVMYTVTRQLKDLAFPVTSGRGLLVESDNVVHADLKEWLGAAPLALSSQRVVGEVGAMAANVLTATAINADAITAAKVATDVSEEIADQVWNELRSGHTTGGSFGEGVASVQGNVTGSVASVVGAVGSVTGDVGGNVTGSVGSVTGAVGSVTGAVGSVTGDVGGDVVGTVASVVGAVGSVTGDVGGNVTGSVGSIATGGIVAASFAAGAIDAAAIANAAIDAATFAAGAINAAAIADGAIDAATFASGAIDAAALNADAATEIADALLKRDIDAVEATAPVHSLTTAILKAVSRIVDDAGTLKTYRTDGSTLHMSQTITVNASADPIDELTVGA